MITSHRIFGLAAAVEMREWIWKAYSYLEGDDIDEVLQYAVLHASVFGLARPGSN